LLDLNHMTKMDQTLLRITGAVASPLALSLEDFSAITGEGRIDDVSTIAPARQGTAITLARLLKLAGANAAAGYLGLHAARDDFHASIPLAPVRESALVIFRLGDGPLPVENGGPIRLFIPEAAACKSAEIDECASVKHLDHIEVSFQRGHDNRPHDDREHEALHARQDAGH
jgi:DMSO/TMAO reductase YedYZ molybdopterin-dependent catalytic subunit